MGYIYKIINQINNKVYVGKTVTTIANRWLHHLDDYKKFDWHLYRAMRKYGIEHFSIEQIEECDDEIINEREIYWIEKLDTFHSGYNSTLGGEGRKQIPREEVIKLWEKGYSIKEIALYFDVWYSSIVEILKEQNHYDIEEIQKRKHLEIAKSQSEFGIIQYSPEGKKVNTYNSILEASIATGFKPSAIRSAIYQQVGAGGYLWAKEGDPAPTPRVVKTYFQKNIIQMTLKGEYINTFSSAAEASRVTGANASAILKVCKGQRKSSGGFLWAYEG